MPKQKPLTATDVLLLIQQHAITKSDLQQHAQAELLSTKVMMDATFEKWSQSTVDSMAQAIRTEVPPIAGREYSKMMTEPTVHLNSDENRDISRDNLLLEMHERMKKMEAYVVPIVERKEQRSQICIYLSKTRAAWLYKKAMQYEKRIPAFIKFVLAVVCAQWVMNHVIDRDRDSPASKAINSINVPQLLKQSGEH